MAYTRKTEITGIGPYGYMRQAEGSGLSSLFGIKAGFDDPARSPGLISSIASAIDLGAKDTTPMMTRLTGNDFSVNVADKSTNTFISSAPVTTGAAAVNNVNASLSEVKDTKKEYLAAFKQARENVCNAIYEVSGSHDRGVAALNTLGAFDSEASHGSAVGTAVANAYFGGAAFNLLSVVNEVKSEKNTLSKKEIESILAEARDLLILKQQTPSESRAEEAYGAVAKAPPKIDWKEAKIDDLATLVGGVPTKQPEYVKLDQQENYLLDMKENHAQVKRDYALTADTAAVSGVTEILSAIEHGAQQITLDTRRKSEISFDATGASLTGDMLSGFEYMKVYGKPEPMPTVEKRRQAVAAYVPPELTGKLQASLGLG